MSGQTIGGFTYNPSDVVSQWAATQLADRKKRGRRLFMAVVMFVLFTVITYYTVREKYMALFMDLEAMASQAGGVAMDGTKLALKLTLSQIYPFLRPLFFNNPNTPNAIINLYYTCIVDAGDDAGKGPFSTVANKYRWPLSGIFTYNPQSGDPWLDGSLAVNTMFGFFEYNHDSGMMDLMNSCNSASNGQFFGIKDDTSLFTATITKANGYTKDDNTSNATFCSVTAGDYAQAGLNAVFHYVLPVVMLIAMFAAG